jgi:hypothetical protein
MDTETETRAPQEVEKISMVEERKKTASQCDSSSAANHHRNPDNDSSKLRTESGNETEAVETEVDEDQKWMKGWSLVTMMAAVIVVIFLMLLDTSIISTVWCYSITSNPLNPVLQLIFIRLRPQGNSEDHNGISLST